MSCTSSPTFHLGFALIGQAHEGREKKQHLLLVAAAFTSH